MDSLVIKHCVSYLGVKIRWLRKQRKVECHLGGRVVAGSRRKEMLWKCRDG